MTVADYKKFIELAKYALAFIVDEEDKCKNFEGSLRTVIHTLLTASELVRLF